MASSIISDTIDGAYPVAGIDNDTQGFRDNFTIIKTGLATATSEITTLQNTTAKLIRLYNSNRICISSYFVIVNFSVTLYYI